jgi:hypothetical protein
MSEGTLIWIILYGISTLAFFSVAAGITVYGIQDLRSLLSKANKRIAEGKNDNRKG